MAAGSGGGPAGGVAGALTGAFAGVLGRPWGPAAGRRQRISPCSGLRGHSGRAVTRPFGAVVSTTPAHPGWRHAPRTTSFPDLFADTPPLYQWYEENGSLGCMSHTERVQRLSQAARRSREAHADTVKTRNIAILEAAEAGHTPYELAHLTGLRRQTVDDIISEAAAARGPLATPGGP